ncbi:hypothetical protein TrVE_jg4537 [Triparma verrucosa]|nr:hypothetical protein TrVE_jg4537 [Triparma verrucosa]
MSHFTDTEVNYHDSNEFPPKAQWRSSTGNGPYDQLRIQVELPIGTEVEVEGDEENGEEIDACEAKIKEAFNLFKKYLINENNIKSKRVSDLHCLKHMGDKEQIIYKRFKVFKYIFDYQDAVLDISREEGKERNKSEEEVNTFTQLARSVGWKKGDKVWDRENEDSDDDDDDDEFSEGWSFQLPTLTWISRWSKKPEVSKQDKKKEKAKHKRSADKIAYELFPPKNSTILGRRRADILYEGFKISEGRWLDFNEVDKDDKDRKVKSRSLPTVRIEYSLEMTLGGWLSSPFFTNLFYHKQARRVLEEWKKFAADPYNWLEDGEANNIPKQEILEEEVFKLADTVDKKDYGKAWGTKRRSSIGMQARLRHNTTLNYESNEPEAKPALGNEELKKSSSGATALRGRKPTKATEKSISKSKDSSTLTDQDFLFDASDEKIVRVADNAIVIKPRLYAALETGDPVIYFIGDDEDARAIDGLKNKAVYYVYKWENDNDNKISLATSAKNALSSKFEEIKDVSSKVNSMLGFHSFRLPLSGLQTMHDISENQKKISEKQKSINKLENELEKLKNYQGKAVLDSTNTDGSESARERRKSSKFLSNSADRDTRGTSTISQKKTQAQTHADVAAPKDEEEGGGNVGEGTTNPLMKSVKVRKQASKATGGGPRSAKKKGSGVGRVGEPKKGGKGGKGGRGGAGDIGDNQL